MGVKTKTRFTSVTQNLMTALLKHILISNGRTIFNMNQ